MYICHPSESLGRKGRINPDALRAALIDAGLLRPRPPEGLTRSTTTGPRLELDAFGRAVAAARVSGEISERDDCGTFLESWLSTDLSRRLRKGTP